MTISLRLAILAPGLLLLTSLNTFPDLHAEAQAPPQIERAVDESGFTITCETFCSETKLRTANARIRWHVTNPGPQAAALTRAVQTLQATVFAQGFAKNLYVDVPIGPGVPQQPRAATTGERQRPLRAFQFRVLQLEQPRTTAAGAPEPGIVVEDLEPGVIYRWRIVTGGGVPGVAEPGAAPNTSPIVVCKAPVCPADIIREQPAQRARR